MRQVMHALAGRDGTDGRYRTATIQQYDASGHYMADLLVGLYRIWGSKALFSRLRMAIFTQLTKPIPTNMSVS